MPGDSISTSRPLTLSLLGVGAMNSPRFPPAGLLVSCSRLRVMLDEGPGAMPDRPVKAWLLTDERAELGPAIRRRAQERGPSDARPTSATPG
jgi:hypothetical protein